MLTSEISNQPVRVNSTYVDGSASVYSVRLLPADARSLGLREGQILNAVFAMRPDGNVFLVNGDARRQIKAPGNFRADPGIVRFSASISASGAAVLTLMPSLDKAQNSNSSIDRIHSLLGRIPGSISGWSEFISNVDTEGKYKADLGISIGTSLISLRLQGAMSQIVRDLYLSLLQSGIFHEAQKRDGDRRSPNVKDLIIRLLNLKQGQHLDRVLLRSVIDEIESNQLEALGAMLNRGVSLTWPVPIFNGLPIHLHIEAEDRESGSSRGEGEEDREWKVDLRFDLGSSSNLDARLNLKKDQLSVHVWCPSLTIYQEASVHKNWLIKEAEKLGLNISELRIYPSSKPSAISNSSIRGYSIDYRADPGISIDA